MIQALDIKLINMLYRFMIKGEMGVHKVKAHRGASALPPTPRFNFVHNPDKFSFMELSKKRNKGFTLKDN